MKRLISALVCSVLLSCFACSAAVAEKTPITLWFFDNGAKAMPDFVNSYKAAFNAANPDIDLDFRLVTNADVQTNVLIAAATGVGPDICYLSSNLIPQFISQNVTLPLNRYLDKFPGKSDIVPDLFSQVTDEKGQIHGLPFAMWSIYDLYNTRVYFESGISLPNNWDSLIAATRKITQQQADGTVTRYGYVGQQNGIGAIYNLHMAMEQLGGKGIINIGDTKVDLVNERGVKALTYMRELWQAGMPNNRFTNKIADSTSGMVAVQSYATYNLMEVDPKDLQDVEPRRVVGPEAGKDSIRFNCATLYILSTSKHPDAAWRVMQDFISAENNAKYITAQVSYLPVRKSVLAQMNKLVTHPLAQKMAKLMYSPMLTYGALNAYWQTVRTDGGNIILNAIQGNVGIQSALEEAQQKMNNLILNKMGK